MIDMPPHRPPDTGRHAPQRCPPWRPDWLGGFAFGVVDRAWMRLISENPGFTQLLVIAFSAGGGIK